MKQIIDNILNYAKMNKLMPLAAIWLNETKVVELIFWGKIAQPLVTLVMIILAVPCIFGPLRQSTMGVRLLGGLFLGFSFYIFTQVFSHMIVSDAFPPVLGIFLPILLILACALISIQKLR